MKLRRIVLLMALIFIGAFASQAKSYEFVLVKMDVNMAIDWTFTFDGNMAKIKQGVMQNAQIKDEILRESKISSVHEIKSSNQNILNGAVVMYNQNNNPVFILYANSNGTVCSIAYINNKNEEIEFKVENKRGDTKFLNDFQSLKKEYAKGTLTIPSSASATTTPKSQSASLKTLTINDFLDHPFGFLSITSCKTVSSTLKALGAAGWPNKPGLVNPNDLVSIDNREGFTIPYIFEGMPVRGMSSWYKKGKLWRYNMYCYGKKTETSQQEMVKRTKSVIKQLKDLGYTLITLDPKKYPNFASETDFILFATLEKQGKRINVSLKEATDYRKKDSYKIEIYVYL
ncbi:MAG: hypothetical protein NC111_06905 [Bacteroides sp.]|nr:hypothetical protein [Bacteroides sp.]MCM1413746.1 hypothetical protein [Bacteroides sp.]MCM1472235.1 hypothetical protein [Bacteroides sp.]